jgi:hypothetical protein
VYSFTTNQRLKFYIMANGIEIDPAAEKEWLSRYGGPVSLREYASTSGIGLITEDGIYINAPFSEPWTTRTEASLRFLHGNFVIVRGSLIVRVTVIPVPAYHSLTHKVGLLDRPDTDYGVTHTDRFRCGPVAGGCAWNCTFCDLGYERTYRLHPVKEILRVFELALEDPLTPARHGLISGGVPLPEDEREYDAACRAIIKWAWPVPFDIMRPPHRDLGYAAEMLDMGANAVSINVEVGDPMRAKRIIPQKYQQFGRNNYYMEFIAECVRIFPPGHVQSLLLFGEAIEPIESTLKTVQMLVDIGCVPVLSPFRPDRATPMRNKPPASEDEMVTALSGTLEICAKSGTLIKPGPRCVPDLHNTVAIDDGSDFYVGLAGDLTRPLM